MVQIHSPRPLPKILPFNGLRDVCAVSFFFELCTNVDQFKSKTAFRPLLTEFHIFVECQIKVADFFKCMPTRTVRRVILQPSPPSTRT